MPFFDRLKGVLSATHLQFYLTALVMKYFLLTTLILRNCIVWVGSWPPPLDGHIVCEIYKPYIVHWVVNEYASLDIPSFPIVHTQHTTRVWRGR